MLQDLTITLEINPGAAHPPVVHVSQYDTGRRLKMKLTDNGTEFFISPDEVRIEGTKPDKRGFSYTTVSTDTVYHLYSFTIKDQMTAVGGKTVCELILKKDNEQIATANFILDVEPSALEDDVDLSSSELAPYMDAAAASAQRAEIAAAQVEAEEADIANQVWEKFFELYGNQEF